jgi:hypothetical protein
VVNKYKNILDQTIGSLGSSMSDSLRSTITYSKTTIAPAQVRYENTKRIIEGKLGPELFD